MPMMSKPADSAVWHHSTNSEGVLGRKVIPKLTCMRPPSVAGSAGNIRRSPRGPVGPGGRACVSGVEPIVARSDGIMAERRECRRGAGPGGERAMVRVAGVQFGGHVDKEVNVRTAARL